MRRQNNRAAQYSWFAWAVPIALLMAQVAGSYAALTLIAAFALAAVLHKPTRKISILISVLISGYLLWLFAHGCIEQFARNIGSQSLAAVLSRLGLIGYLLLLFGWYLWDKTGENYFKIGSLSASINIPLIWRGFNDKVLRASGVFSAACLAVAGIFAAINRLNFELIGMGIAFSCVNAVLEEL